METTHAFENKKITDKRFISIIKKSSCSIMSLKAKAEKNFETIQVEQDLVEQLRSDNSLAELCKAFLYYAWHRCIIEERIYQQPHYGGSRTFLDIIK